MPTTVAVYAHPDDECIALGGRLGRLADALLIHVTDGSPKSGEDARKQGFASQEIYRDARIREFKKALTAAGIPEVRYECLLIPDQEASLQLCDLTMRLLRILERERPEVVFTHPYEGGHPDHDATAFAVHVAVRRMRHRGDRAPVIIEGTSYHLGPEGIRAGHFLPATPPVQERRMMLLAHQQRRKQALLACFASQAETLQYFPTAWECFRLAPAYDFSRPPHTPPVFYDGFPWGMTSDRFCVLAQEAECQFQEEVTDACH